MTEPTSDPLTEMRNALIATAEQMQALAATMTYTGQLSETGLELVKLGESNQKLAQAVLAYAHAANFPGKVIGS